jgi:hypothetical protein
MGNEEKIGPVKWVSTIRSNDFGGSFHFVILPQHSLLTGYATADAANKVCEVLNNREASHTALAKAAEGAIEWYEANKDLTEDVINDDGETETYLMFPREPAFVALAREALKQAKERC